MKMQKTNTTIEDISLSAQVRYWEKMYEDWIGAANMVEEDFLQFCLSEKVKLEKTLLGDKKMRISLIAIKKDGTETIIGVPFEINENEKGETFALLIYITRKLDRERKRRKMHYYELDFNGYERSDENTAYALCIKTEIKNISKENALKIIGKVREEDRLTYLKEISEEEAKKYFNVNELVVYNDMGFGTFFTRMPLPEAGACETNREPLETANPLLGKGVMIEGINREMFFTTNVLKFMAEDEEEENEKYKRNMQK